MANFYAQYPIKGGSGGGVPIYPNVAAFPAIATTGSLAVDASTGNLYEFNGTSWVQIGGPGAALTLGAFDSQTPDARGAGLTGGVLAMQSATGSVPGLMSTGNQTFSGIKNFSANIFAANLSGTNSGDVTLGTANGLSLSGQILSLGLSSTSTTGALSSANWNTFNGKQNALTIGNLTDVGTDGITITGGTGAVIGTGTSISQQVADTTHNGYLSSVDWNTFNGKQNALTLPLAVTNGGTGTATAFTAGSVVFAGTSGVYSQNNGNFFWDSTNNRLGIGTNASSATNIFQSMGYKPTSVGTTPGTASTSVFAVVGGSGGDSTLTTTAVGGVGAQASILSGQGGVAASAATSSTGGNSGGVTISTNTAGAATVAGTGVNIGGTGGALNVTGGTGGAATGVTSGTNSGGPGTRITITSGNGGAASGSTTANLAAIGGAVNITGGSPGLASGTGAVQATGGIVTISGGTAAAASGSLPGTVSIQGGTASTTADGGNGGGVSILGTAAGGDNTASRSAGTITLSIGAAKGSAVGSAINMTAGTGGIGISTAGAGGGPILIQGGAGGAGSSTGGVGGAVTLRGGSAPTVAGTFPGTASVVGGIGSGATAGGPGGQAVVQGSNATGDNSVANQGGGASLLAGNSVGSSVGAAVTVKSGTGGVGAATSAFAGGVTTVQGGAGGVNTTNGAGGNLVLNGGLSGGAGTGGGAILLQTAATTSLTTAVTISNAQVVTLAHALAVTSGGTGLGTLTANNVILGNGTSNPTFVAPSTSGNVLTSNGSTWISSPSSGGSSFTSEIKILTLTGVGSGAGNRTYTFSSVLINNGGSDLTYTSDAVNGDSITINTAGRYIVQFNFDLAGSDYAGITLNGSATTSMALQPAANILGMARPGSASFNTSITACHNFSVNDVIRAQSAGTNGGANTNAEFLWVTRIS